MTTLMELQLHLDSLGVRVSASGEKLVVDAPAGVLTPEIKAALATHKAEFLERHRELESCPGLSDSDALNAISRIVWDGKSLAESIGQGRRHNEEVRKRK